MKSEKQVRAQTGSGCRTTWSEASEIGAPDDCPCWKHSVDLKLIFSSVSGSPSVETLQSVSTNRQSGSHHKESALVSPGNVQQRAHVTASTPQTTQPASWLSPIIRLATDTARGSGKYGLHDIVMVMSKWQESKQAFVWTLVEGEARPILLYNQSKRGVYVIFPNSYHISIHTDGRSHIRSGHEISKKIREMPFTLPPLAAIESHFLQAIHLATPPHTEDSHRGGIAQPPPDSAAIFLDPAAFPWGTQPMIESAVYIAAKREELHAWLQMSLVQRPNMDLLQMREYPLDDHKKFLGVFLYRVRYLRTAEGFDNDEFR